MFIPPINYFSIAADKDSSQPYSYFIHFTGSYDEDPPSGWEWVAFYLIKLNHNTGDFTKTLVGYWSVLNRFYPCGTITLNSGHILVFYTSYTTSKLCVKKYDRDLALIATEEYSSISPVYSPGEWFKTTADQNDNIYIVNPITTPDANLVYKFDSALVYLGAFIPYGSVDGKVPGVRGIACNSDTLFITTYNVSSGKYELHKFSNAGVFQSKIEDCNLRFISYI